MPETDMRPRLGHLVARVAPGLAKALGGPLASSAIRQISEAFLGIPDASEITLLERIPDASPARWERLRKAEREFALALEEAEVARLRVIADDRADARRRHEIMTDRTPAVLGALIVGGFFIVLGAMVLCTLPAGAETEFSIMLGALATMTAAVVNYFFGSSAGSKEKMYFMHSGRYSGDGRNGIR